MTSTFDPARIDGLFTHPVVLADYELALGLMRPDGEALTICAWDGRFIRKLSQDAARKWAADLRDGLESLTFRPVWEALLMLADRVDEINTEAMFRRAGKAAVRAVRIKAMPSLDELVVQGHA